MKGSPFYICEEKLRKLKIKLKGWAKSLPHPAKERKMAQESLEQHHIQNEEAEITREVLDKEADLQKKYHQTCLQE